MYLCDDLPMLAVGRLSAHISPCTYLHTYARGVQLTSSHDKIHHCSDQKMSPQYMLDHLLKEKRSTMPEHTVKKSTVPQGFLNASF